jgi:hypothetical protein
MTADAQQAEPEAAEHTKAATEAVLALAQKLHDEYVVEGHNTRERLISEGQSRHDQIVGEATARQEELISTGQAKYDESVSAGKTKHDALIAEADALVAEAQQKKAEVRPSCSSACRSSPSQGSLLGQVHQWRVGASCTIVHARRGRHPSVR